MTTTILRRTIFVSARQQSRFAGHQSKREHKTKTQHEATMMLQAAKNLFFLLYFFLLVFFFFLSFFSSTLFLFCPRFSFVSPSFRKNREQFFGVAVNGDTLCVCVSRLINQEGGNEKSERRIQARARRLLACILCKI